MHIAANYPSPFKIAINDGVSIEAPKPDSTIFSKITSVIREFSVFPLTATAILSFAATLTFVFSLP